MLPNSRQHDAQRHVQQFPSTIRTRSQQQQPLLPVDMYASPLKEAMRHNQNRNHSQTRFCSSRPEHKVENLKPVSEGSVPLTLSPMKRASSPSLAGSDQSPKRVKVLAETSNTSPTTRRQLEDPPKASVKDYQIATPSAKTFSSPSRGIIHMDLSEIAGTPGKRPVSPSKTFKITVGTGHTVSVPVTPVRRLHALPHQSSETKLPRPSTPDRGYPCQKDIDEQQPSSPTPCRASATFPHQKQSVELEKSPFSHPALSTKSETKTFSVRDRFLSNYLHLGSPLTPLPKAFDPRVDDRCLETSNVSTAQSISNGPVPNTPSHNARALLSHITSNSPRKSYIPVPVLSSSSRLPRASPSALFPMRPGMIAASPIKRCAQPSPLKSRLRSKGKAKASIINKIPAAKLPVKQSSRNISSYFAPVAKKATSHAQPGGMSKLSKASPTESSLTTPPRGPPNEGPPSLPAESTPLSALSTALEKLQATPPTAPLPRLSTGSSLSNTANTSTQSSSLPGKNVITNSTAKTSNQRSQEHSGLTGVRGIGKLGLPLRRPSTASGTGKLSPWISGAPFASQGTALSTIPASPAKSTQASSSIHTTTHEPVLTSDNIFPEIVDVDSLSPSEIKEKGEKAQMTLAEDCREYSIPINDKVSGGISAPQPVSPSRRASHACMSLTQSLTSSRPTGVVPVKRSLSASNAHFNPRTPIKTRGSVKPNPVPPVENDKSLGGKRLNARMPGSLDVLKDCVIFVDVRTEEGEDAGALFVDMLRGLGARILNKPGKSCTHLVYKAGLPSTITRYKLLPEPRPFVVGIGWVVECVEKRMHIEENRFLMNLYETGVAGGQRRRSMQPKQMRTLSLGQLENGEFADISVRADSSFTSDEPSSSALNLAQLSPHNKIFSDNLPPLERARQRSFRLPRG